MNNLKILLLLLLTAFSNMVSAQLSPKEIVTLKTDMVKAVENARLTDSIYAKLDKLPNKSALITAYLGVLEALKAKHSWNPYNKVKFVKDAQATFQKAVAMDKDNLEIRFMRYSTEHYTPSFLGLSKNLDKDRKEIVKQYKNHNFGVADVSMVKSIAKFMIESKRCTLEEVKVLQKYI